MIYFCQYDVKRSALECVQMSMMGDTNSKKYKIGYLPYENVIFSAENVMVS